MKKVSFSKFILFFESILVAVVTWKVLAFTELSINLNFEGSLPYLVTMITVIFSAYGVSVSFYYNKAKNENMLYIQNGHEMEKIKLNSMPIGDYDTYNVPEEEPIEFSSNIDCDPI